MRKRERGGWKSHLWDREGGGWNSPHYFETRLRMPLDGGSTGHALQKFHLCFSETDNQILSEMEFQIHGRFGSFQKNSVSGWNSEIELNSVLFRFRGSVCPNRSILLLFTLIFSPAVSPRFTYSFSRLFLLSPLALVQCFMLNLHRLCCFSRLFLFLFLLSLTVYLKEGLYDHCSCTLYFPIKPIVPADDWIKHVLKHGNKSLDLGAFFKYQSGPLTRAISSLSQTRNSEARKLAVMELESSGTNRHRRWGTIFLKFSPSPSNRWRGAQKPETRPPPVKSPPRIVYRPQMLLPKLPLKRER